MHFFIIIVTDTFLHDQFPSQTLQASYLHNYKFSTFSFVNDIFCAFCYVFIKVYFTR